MTTTTTTPVWYTRCPSPTASSVALAGGWLEAEFAGTGIQLRSLADSPDREVRQSHFTQGQAAQFRQGGIVPPLWAAARGAPVTLLGISEVPRFQGVIALPGSGLSGPADLRGARLGLPRRTAEPVDFWRAHCLRGLTTALTLAGLDEDEVTWVDLPTDEPYHADRHRRPGASLWAATEAARLQRPEVLALVRGQVDAIYTYAPTGLGLIELLGAQVVATLPSEGERRGGIGSLSVLTVGTAVLEDQPEVVVRYLAGLLRAAAWARHHADDVIRVIAAEEGVPEEWAAATFGHAAATFGHAAATFGHAAAGAPVDASAPIGSSADGHAPTGSTLALDLRPSLADDLVDVLQGEADFLYAHQFVDRPVDVSGWADARALTEAEAIVAHVVEQKEQR